jgi:DUF1680 family protein
MIKTLETPAYIKKEVNGELITLPHLWDMTMGKWLSRELYSRVSTNNPVLEYRIAASLAATDEFEANEQELQYICEIVTAMETDSMGVKIDNLFKSQVLACLR